MGKKATLPARKLKGCWQAIRRGKRSRCITIRWIRNAAFWSEAPECPGLCSYWGQCSSWWVCRHRLYSGIAGGHHGNQSPSRRPDRFRRQSSRIRALLQELSRTNRTFTEALFINTGMWFRIVPAMLQPTLRTQRIGCSKTQFAGLMAQEKAYHQTCPVLGWFDGQFRNGGHLGLMGR